MPSSSAASIQRLLRIAIAAYIFVLVLAMFPYSSDPTGHIKKLITCWFAVGLAAAWGLAVWRGRIPFWRPRIGFEIFLCLLAFYAVSTALSAYLGYSLIELGYFVYLFLLYLIASQVYRTPAHVRGLVFSLCAAVALAAAYAFAQKAGLDPFPWSDRESDVYTNLPATFGNPNYAAHTLILAIIMAVYAATHPRRRWAILFMLPFAAHLYFTQQRAGIFALAAAAALAVAAWRLGARFKRPLLTVAATLGVVTLAGVLALLSIMTVQKLRTGVPFPLDVSLLIRYQSYVSASEMILDRPLIGHGPGVYAITYPEYWTNFEQEWFAQEFRMNRHVHNDLMEVAIDAGLPAAGLYLALLVLGICYSLLLSQIEGPPARRRLGYALAAFFAAFLVDGLFGFNLRVPVSAALFALFLGILEGIYIAAAEAKTLRPTGPRLRWALRAGAVVLAFFLLLGTAVFASECLLLRGMVFRYQAESMQNRGDAAGYQDALDSARSYFTLGETLAPWNWRFPLRRGEVAVLAQDLPQAILHYERALQRNPYYIMTLIPLASAKVALAQVAMKDNPGNIEGPMRTLDEAALLCERALEICPMFPTAEGLLAQIASTKAIRLSNTDPPAGPDTLRRLWSRAEYYLLRSIQHGAQDLSDRYRMLAEVRMATGNAGGAEEALVRAVQADPANPAVWPAFFKFAEERGQYGRLRNTLELEIDRMKQDPNPDAEGIANACIWLAGVAQRQAPPELDVAERALIDAIEFAPNRVEVWTNFARFAVENDRLPLFEQTLRDANAKVRAGGAEPLPHLAALESVLEQGPAAIDRASLLLLEIWRGYEQNRRATAGVAMGWTVQMLVQKIDEAAAATDQQTCLGNLNLGILAAELNELPTAERLLRRAVDCLEGDTRAAAYLHLADCLMRLERPDEALALLQQAHDTYPGNLDVQWARARTLGALGRFSEALLEYEALLGAPNLPPSGRERLEAELRALQEGRPATTPGSSEIADETPPLPDPEPADPAESVPVPALTPLQEPAPSS